MKHLKNIVICFVLLIATTFTFTLTACGPSEENSNQPDATSLARSLVDEIAFKKNYTAHVANLSTNGEESEYTLQVSVKDDVQKYLSKSEGQDIAYFEYSIENYEVYKEKAFDINTKTYTEKNILTKEDYEKNISNLLMGSDSVLYMFLYTEGTKVLETDNAGRKILKCTREQGESSFTLQIVVENNLVKYAKLTNEKGTEKEVMSIDYTYDTGDVNFDTSDYQLLSSTL